MIKKSGIPIEQQAEFRELLEAVRRAGYAEGYAAAKMETVLAAPVEAETPPAPPAAITTPAPDNRDKSEYVSRIPFNTTKTMALEYLGSVKRAAGPTEIIKNTYRKTGTRLTMTTLRRALDALAEERLIELVDNSRWKFAEENRAVPLRPVR